MAGLPKDAKKEDRHALQLEWVIKAGTLAHYIGDLSQPLHVTENHDGAMTNQKGIHSFFEDTVVNELVKNLGHRVFADTKKLWPNFHKKHAKSTIDELITALSTDSRSRIDELLKTDKKVGRADLDKVASKYENLIVQRLTTGALFLAEIYTRNANWDANTEKFYAFEPNPSFVKPPVSKD